MAAPTFDQLRTRYSVYWRGMVCERVSTLDAAAAGLIGNKARYEKVGRALGIPWWFIAILHQRESSGDFRGVLHNGEHIIGTGKETRLVPAGRGPFGSWEDAAIDALKLKGLHRIRGWPVERVCYEAERYNGFGYYFRGVPSAYLWSFSNIYQGGKYVADGVWDPSTRDQQVGVMPLLNRMMVADRSIRFGPSRPIVTPETGAAGGIGAGGAGAAAGAARQGHGPEIVIGILVATAVIALVAFIIIRAIRRKKG